jgi:hypothetical protein
MNDNPLPIKDQPDQGSGTSSDPAAKENINPNQLDMTGRTSDPRGTIQITPSESQTTGNQANQPLVDGSRDIPSENKSLPSTDRAENIVEAWLDKNVADEMRSRWNAIQVQFVDSPCTAVEQGDALVAEVMEKFDQILSGKQNAVHQQWLNHDDITTEELRITLQNYRSILDHLLKL